MPLEVFQEKYKNLDVSFRDKVRYEQVGNVIYLMSQPARLHEIIITEIIGQFRDYFKKKSCLVYGSNLGLDLSDYISELTELESFREYLFNRENQNKATFLPDLQVICDNREELFGPDGYKKPSSLIIEVWSPSTGERDLGFKKDMYERVGISEYWVVLDIRNVLVYTLVNGKYSLRRYSLDRDLFLEDDVNKDILAVPSLIFSDLVIRLDKKDFYK